MTDNPSTCNFSMKDGRMKESRNKIRFLKLDYHSGSSQEMHFQALKRPKAVFKFNNDISR